MWVITKKIKEAQARGELGDVGGADGETTMAMKKGRGGGGGGGGGKKRKAASEEVEGEEDEAENPKKATRNKGGRKGKKAKATPPAVTEDNGEAGGNGELLFSVLHEDGLLTVVMQMLLPRRPSRPRRRVTGWTEMSPARLPDLRKDDRR